MSFQILFDFMKEYNIQNIVVAADRNHPDALIRQLTEQTGFKSYFIENERCAAYFAYGITLRVKELVAVVCPAGNGVSQLLSGVTEAFYQETPLLIITSSNLCDTVRFPHEWNAIQPRVFDGVCKKSFDIPFLPSQNAIQRTECILTEAFIELDHCGKGPIHINVREDVAEDDTGEHRGMYRAHRVAQMNPIIDAQGFTEALMRLKNKKILVVCEQSSPYASELTEDIAWFSNHFNAVFGVNGLSNLHFAKEVYCDSIIDHIDEQNLQTMLPDCVIHMGQHVINHRLHRWLLGHRDKIEHWLISDSYPDFTAYEAVDTVFTCTPACFFGQIQQHAFPESTGNQYRQAWEQMFTKVEKMVFSKSDQSLARAIVQSIPPGSVVHLGVREAHDFSDLIYLAKDVSVFCNMGVKGVVGTVSTFVGQSAAASKPCYLIINDTALFADMNAMWIRHHNNRIRIILLNNHNSVQTAGELRMHGLSVRGWADTLDYTYYTAQDTKTVLGAMEKMAASAARPGILECIGTETNRIEQCRLAAARGTENCTQR